MADPAWIDALTDATRGSRVATADSQLYLEEREDLSFRAGNRFLPVSVANRMRGLSARGSLEGERLVHLADPSPEQALPLLACALDPRLPVPDPHWRDGDPSHAALSPDLARPLLAELVDQASRGSGDVSLQASWIGFEQRVWIARPDRPVVEDRRRGSRVRVDAEVRRKGQRSAATTEAILPPADANNYKNSMLVERAIERAEQRLDAVAARPGETIAVLAPGVGGVLVHELVGHALEADAAARGTWILQAEESVAPAGLTVIDDPRRGRAAWSIDDEGEAARATPLVRDGRVTGRLHDLRTARRESAAATGHGRRASYRDPVRPRMGCTFVAPGRLEPEEVLLGISEGVYVRRMEAASVDPFSGRAVFRVTDADRIEDGRLSGPLVPHLMSVDAGRALASIDRIANDLRFDTCVGSCHRDGQALAISVGAPTIRIGLIRVRT